MGYAKFGKGGGRRVGRQTRYIMGICKWQIAGCRKVPKVTCTPHGHFKK